MKNATRNLFAMVVISYALSACQTVGEGRAVYESTSANKPGNAQKLGEAASGDTISLPSENGGTDQTVTVGDIYTAASGRECKRLFSVDGQPMNQVVCLNKAGKWVLQKSLRVKTTSYSVVPDVFSDPETVQPTIEVPASFSASDTTNISIDISETLWSFSHRVTGNGENWEKIADLNSIKDAWKMSGSRMLLVPRSMLTEVYAIQSVGDIKADQQ